MLFWQLDFHRSSFICQFGSKYFQVRARYEKVLEEVNNYAPRYMEEMESVFDQSQEEERKRIVFLKQAFLSIHKHLDITNNERWSTVLCTCAVLRKGAAAAAD